MLVSEFINRLEWFEREYGDIPVVADQEWAICPPIEESSPVVSYEAEGAEDSEGKLVECLKIF